MNWAIINFEYEFVLFKDHLIEYQKIHSSFFEEVNYHNEFIFFFIETNKKIGLAARNQYENEYLEYLKSLGLGSFEIKPILSIEQNSFFWVGSLSDISLERSLNSKIWLYSKLKELNLLKTPFCIYDQDTKNAEKILGNDILVKNPYLYGGVGNKRISKVSDLDEKDKGSILEPWFNVVEQISFYFDYQDKKLLVHLNKSNKDGRYIGTRVFEDQSSLSQFLAKRNLIDLFEEQCLAVGKFTEYLHSEYEIKQDFSIDGYFFNDGSTTRCFPICDLNYRLSLSKLAHSMKQFLPKRGVGDIIFIDKKKNLDFRRLRSYCPLERTGVIVLSPEASKVACLFISANDESQLNRILAKVMIFIGKKTI